MGNVIFPFRTTAKAQTASDVAKDIEVLKINSQRKIRDLETRRRKAINNALTSNDHRRKLYYMKIIKMYDKEIERLLALQLNLETCLLALEGSEINVQMVKITRETTSVLKRESNINEVGKIQEEYESIMDDIKEIDSIMYNDNMNPIDAEELEGELQKLLSETTQSQRTSIEERDTRIKEYV